ncbi:ESX secretion-associated protein EspG [Saccharothrix variisporea]|uniref:ESAT-6 protein secretion system EspG family protein n=1 Tax=Saccharothrix variisporea TaxID=543527 RepID=A0A495XDM5_9PSEU|nr:ESX secretion-associated protein EspG [Saccharothrix variisporea]RKT71759.1 ESAT-6 protein secretion system EspG family protein [Saccharothrix variisporea]
MTTATMSAAAFRTAWDHLDLGAMPIVLHVADDPAPWHDLTAAGLARGAELDPWLGAAFKLLANPPRSADLRLGFGSSAVRALAASATAGTVPAGAGMVPASAETASAGAGTASAGAEAAAAGAGTVLAVLTGAVVTVRELESDLAAALVGLLPVLGGGRVGGADLRGRFGAAVLDADGHRRRSADVVDFHGPTDPAALRAAVTALLDELSS